MVKTMKTIKKVLDKFKVILKNNKGITLLEIIVSLAILSTIIIPIYTMFITSQKISTASKIEFEAIAIGQSYIEKIKSSEEFSWISVEDENGIISGSETVDEYTVTLSLEPHESYKNQQTDVNYESLEYDVYILINNNYVANIYDGNDVYKSTISNSELEITYEDNKVSITPGGIEIDNLTGEAINFRVDIRGSMDFVVYNNAGEDPILEFYYIEERENPIDSNLYVLNGAVRKYGNIYFDEIPNEMDYILYKVAVKVYKDSELLTEINGYKAF